MKFGRFDSFEEYTKYCDDHGYARYASEEAFIDAMTRYSSSDMDDELVVPGNNASPEELNINNRLAKGKQFNSYEEYARYADEMGYARFATDEEIAMAKRYYEDTLADDVVAKPAPAYEEAAKKSGLAKNKAINL